MKEEWRDVPGYEGFYQISIATREGKCRSLNYYGFGKGGTLSSTPRNNRIYWGFSKDGDYNNQQAARWIAITFPELIENEYFDGAEIDHKDGNPMNNEPSNLRWVNHLENMSNPNTREKLKRGKGRTTIPVLQFKVGGFKAVAKYKSVEEAGEATGIPVSKIRSCCEFRTKRTGDYWWLYDRYNRYKDK